MRALSVAALLLPGYPTWPDLQLQRDFRVFRGEESRRIVEVLDLAEDADGAVWVATRGDGLHCFHESECRKYTTADGLPSDWVRRVVPDDAGGVWVATAEGVCRIRDGSVDGVIPRLAPGLREEEFRYVEVVQGGRLLLASEGGLVVEFTPAEPGEIEGDWRIIGTAEAFEGGYPADFAEQANGDLWASVPGRGLFRLDGSEWHLTWGEGKDFLLHTMLGDGQERLWAVERETAVVFRLEEGGWRNVTETDAPGGMFTIDAFLPMPDGDILVGTRRGGHVFSSGEWHPIDLPDEVGSPSIRAILLDRQGALWFGAREGLVRAGLKAWQGGFAATDGVELNQLVRGMVPPRPLWVVDERARLVQLENGVFRPVVQLEASQPFPQGVWCFPDEPCLWGLSIPALRKFSSDDGSLLDEWPLMEDVDTTGFFRTSGGEILLLTNRGAFALQAGTWTPFPEVEGYERRGVFDVAELESGVLLAAVENRAELWGPEGVEILDISDNNDVLSIHVRRDGGVWLGALGPGVLRLEGKSLAGSGLAAPPESQLVTRVYEDSAGTLWAAFRWGGVASYRDGRWMTCLYAQGLPNRDVDCIREDDQGGIWVSTREGGVYRFQPDRTPPDTRVKAAPREIVPRGIGSFSFSGRDAWNHTPAEKLEYSWRVTTGTKGDAVAPWAPFARESAAVTPALDSGVYQLEVRASDEELNVDPTPALHEFRVLRPFWQAPAFLAPLVSLVLVAAAALGAAYRTRQRRVQAGRERAEANERLRSIIMNTPGAVYQSTAGPDCTMLLMSGAIADITGYPAEDFTGHASEKASSLTQQLLAFSRRQVLQPKNLNLNEVINDSMKMLRRIIPESIRIDFEPGRELGTVCADASQLSQVLANLAVNSRDAMLDGGQIAIKTGNVLVDSRYCENHPWAKPGRYVLLSVTDTGCGMDEETRQRVFDPFFTTKEVGQGTGQGLAAVYGIVKQHEGMVNVYSEIGKGTEVKIYLRRVERPAAEVEREVEGEGPGGNETILLAEDDEAIRKLAQRILRGAGYTVLTAADGAEAVAAFQAHPNAVDLAVLDVVMPGTGGREAGERMRALNPNLRILYSSGYSANAIHTRFVLDEGLELLEKPYGPEDLLRKVRRVLDA